MFYLFNGQFSSFKLQTIIQKTESSWSSLTKHSSKSEHNKVLQFSIPKSRNCEHSGHTSYKTSYKNRQLFLRLSRLLSTVQRTVVQGNQIGELQGKEEIIIIGSTGKDRKSVKLMQRNDVEPSSNYSWPRGVLYKCKGTHTKLQVQSRSFFLG